jgi:hypothetical protein
VVALDRKCSQSRVRIRVMALQKIPIFLAPKSYCIHALHEDKEEIIMKHKGPVRKVITKDYYINQLADTPGSSQCLALSILRGCNINKFAHDQVTT